jgi:hypothetical protein
VCDYISPCADSTGSPPPPVAGCIACCLHVITQVTQRRRCCAVKLQHVSAVTDSSIDQHVKARRVSLMHPPAKTLSTHCRASVNIDVNQTLPHACCAAISVVCTYSQSCHGLVVFLLHERGASVQHTQCKTSIGVERWVCTPAWAPWHSCAVHHVNQHCFCAAAHFDKRGTPRSTSTHACTSSCTRVMCQYAPCKHTIACVYVHTHCTKQKEHHLVAVCCSMRANNCM